VKNEETQSGLKNRTAKELAPSPVPLKRGQEKKWKRPKTQTVEGMKKWESM